ncbi:unnamed protein product [Pseudo-nitzschia multistriata]|uniref:Uncharacterized protein n=1 Tax=Pseudo-nitzschia multistriata TaxID=183589 RepID=A0A448Z4J3_9STRA|nr:unnamed protein product [Pseudo-nitzschia multistriata]
MSSEEVKEVPVATPEAEVPMKDQEKIGAKCCGCCCDYRRATIVFGILNLISSVWGVVLAIGLLTGGALIGSDGVEEWEDEAGSASLYILGGILMFVSVCGVGFYSFQIHAAKKFNVCGLKLVIAWDIFTICFRIAELIIQQQHSGDVGVMINNLFWTVAIYGLSLYPIVGLVFEIQKGIMSEETYPREAYSCCCEPKV